MRARKGHLVITDRYAQLVHHQLLELGYADSAHGDADSSVAFNVQPRPTGQILIGSSRQYKVEDPAVEASKSGQHQGRFAGGRSKQIEEGTRQIWQ